jgi:UDP-N-acetylmuramate dehydrogenase
VVERDLLRELGELTAVRTDEPLRRHTTFGIGGPADAYVVARSADDLGRIGAACRRHETPFFVLGSGSNILVGDAGIRGVVIENRARRVEQLPDADMTTFRAESGASFAGLARHLAQQGWAGLEWAAGIPGTVGGAVVYNAGAYGGCLADVLVAIITANGKGERRIPASELGLVYRGSAFTRGRLEDQTILAAEFRLAPGDATELDRRVAELDERRLRAQPRGRSAGSVFKNAPEHPAWWLIDQVGLRGHRIGDAQISPKHANFFVNAGQARAADVKALMDLAREKVRERFDIELQPEISLVGEGF